MEGFAPGRVCHRLAVWSPDLGQAAPAGPWVGGASHRNCLWDHRRCLLDPERAMVWGARRSSTRKSWAGGAIDPFSTHPTIWRPILRLKRWFAQGNRPCVCPCNGKAPRTTIPVLADAFPPRFQHCPRPSTRQDAGIAGRVQVHEIPFTKVACSPASEQYSLVTARSASLPPTPHIVRTSLCRSAPRNGFWTRHQDRARQRL